MESPGIRVLTALAIACFAGLGLRPMAQASSSDAKVLSNPLILKNTATGAQAQMMPTPQWLSQHGLPYGSSSSSSTGSSSSPTANLNLPAPACTLATDSSAGDATPLGLPQNDALDLSAFGVSTSSDGKALTGQLSVQSLSDGTNGTPAVSGGGDVWFIQWQSYVAQQGAQTFFLEARYPGAPGDIGFTLDSASGLPVDLAYGHVAPGPGGLISQHYLDGTATGSLDLAHNVITISAPLSGVGTPSAGALLATMGSESDALAGSPAKVQNLPSGLLEKADSMTNQLSDYHVGQAGANCPGPKTSALARPGSFTNLAYYGGPTVHTIKNYAIWWLPQAGTTTYSNGSPCTIPATKTYTYEMPPSGDPTGTLPGGPDGNADYQGIIEQYFKDLAGTSFNNLLTQYADEETGRTGGAETFGGTWTDTCDYTSTASTTTGPLPGGTMTDPIYQLDIQQEVEKAIAVNKWSTGLGNEYFVFTGYGVADCFAPPGQSGLVQACNTTGPDPAYCAYHGDFMDPSGNYVLYADMADAGSAANPGLNLCYQSPIGVTDPTHNVNGNQVTDPIADAEINVTSHEEFETVSDSEVGTAQQLAPPLGWYDPAAGEIGDKCAWNFGNYDPTDGSNVDLHGNHYIVQLEYSNWDNGCALTAYHNNAGYGGAGDTISIQKGWNVIGMPTNGVTTTTALIKDMTRAGQLPANSITQVKLYRNGSFVSSGPLRRTDGILVYSTAVGSYTPSGSVYTSAPAITLNRGWNLVSATYPNPGLSTDAIYNQIEAENNACSAAILTNAPCTPTITEIKVTGPAGYDPNASSNPPVIDWKPSPTDSNGQATWPQTFGDHIPFYGGMWIYASKALTWTVQGSECQSVTSAGVCQ